MEYLEIIVDTKDMHDDSLRQLADRIRLMPLYCKIHPNQKSVLVLSNTSSKGISYLETICCKDFQNQLHNLKLLIQ